ncbi:MAG TPA: RidA family protein [Vicinamibacteria bacterium]|jgi:2-iminobutanoate/2-iminopropanoate deaminase
MRGFASAVALVVLANGVVFAEAPVERREIRLASRPASDVRPFSDAVLVGRTLYLAGRTGGDKDGKIPADAADEARAVMDQIKAVLAQEGMKMDDLVTVQVFCTDVKLYAAFNDVYRTYFTRFPARAFIGSGPLLGGARFEVQGIAEKR